MYLDYWKLKEKPFENTPDPRFFYYSDNHKEALLNLQYAVNENKGAAMLTGEIGCGKTLIAHTLFSRLVPSKFELGMVNNPWLDDDEFLSEILYQFGIETKKDRKIDSLHRFNDFLYSNYLKKKKTILIIDEAQHIRSDAIFEQLRLLLNFQLHNQFLLTLIFIGQPELQKKIAKKPQLDQRISIRFNIEPLSADNTRRFILHRLKLAGRNTPIITNEAVEFIYSYSKGIPRKINNICDLCLVMGFARNLKIIDGSIVKELTSVQDINS